MTSPFALTVEEVRACQDRAKARHPESLSKFEIYFAEEINAKVESKRQSYMSTDRARANYDEDAWRKPGE